MKRIRPEQAPRVIGTRYPSPFDLPCRARERYRLGDAAGLTQFGVNLLRLPPGSWSSQRHWHELEDEFVYVIAGEVTLITDAGEELLMPGDSAGFRGGDPDGHHFVNKSRADVLLLEVGSRKPNDIAAYSDIDMRAEGAGFVRRDGTPYPPTERRS
jgi:uncharacterized cupin superfamily protein